MKYKVGDKVRIRSKEWYDKHKDANGEIRGAFFDKDRAKLCGTIQTIANGGFIDGLGVTIYSVEDAYEFIGEEAIEGLVEEETKFGTASKPIEIKSNANCLTQERVDEMSLDKAGQITDFEYEGVAYTLPEGYIFKDENGNEILTSKIILEKKKKEYPKTYEECCKVLGYDDREVYCIFHTGADETLFEALYRLKVCRDAYWKIAGDEMGLGKPWEPDWTNLEYDKFCIWVDVGDITFRSVLRCQHILAFPTAEMRDAFYENFKELIEQCKALL